MVSVSSAKKRMGIAAFLHEMARNRTLYLMIVPALAFIVIFNYIPLYGLQVAFRNFNFIDGITRSPWVGWANYRFYFRSMFFKQTTFNTLYLNFLFITCGLAM